MINCSSSGLSSIYANFRNIPNQHFARKIVFAGLQRMHVAQFLGATVCLLAISASAAEQPLAIDKAGSHIEIQVKATADSFVGKLTEYAPTVLVDPATGKVSGAKFAFHFKDVKTGNDKRDREMNVWQQTDKFPESDFALETLAPATDGKLMAKGALTLHGVTQTLSFPVAVTRSETKVTIEGDATVDTRTFGLPVIRKFALLKVDPLVVVHFHLVGTISAP
jgi:polyisoprenoid-binding protein YceI